MSFWVDVSGLYSALKILRLPAAVDVLREMYNEHLLVTRVRSTYRNKGLRLHRDVLLQEWSEEQLVVGKDVAIEKGTVLSWQRERNLVGVIEIGDRTWIGQYNNFRLAGAARVVIGKDCLISQFCSIVASNHSIAYGQVIREQEHDSGKCGVTMGDDVWLGAGATVLPGASIASGAVIAAGSVVTSNVGPNEIWAGVPARCVGRRSRLDETAGR